MNSFRDIQELMATGCLAPLLSITVVRMISFGIYESSAQNISRVYGRLTGNENAVEKARLPGARPTIGSLASFAGAGALTGGVITFISCESKFDNEKAHTLTCFQGPFELTKLYSQIYVIIQEEERKRKLKEAIAKGLKPPPTPPKPLPGTRIKGEGTFAVGRRLVRDRGFFGLFTGFRLHFSMCQCLSSGTILDD